MLKRLVALFLLVLMSINTFAAVVSDNDGPAFVTKAEFEVLKQELESNIDRYNTSLDTKIDGVIAGYVNGIKVSTKTNRRVLRGGIWESVSTKYSSSDYTWRYKYGSIRIQTTSLRTGPCYSQSQAYNCWYFNLPYPTYDENKHRIHKLAISNVNPTNKTAEWYGISYNANDYAQFITTDWGTSLMQNWNGNVYVSMFRPRGDAVDADELIGTACSPHLGLGDSSGGLNYEYQPTCRQFVQDWGTIKNKQIILTNDSFKYRNFSRYPRSRNWGFWTTDTSQASSYEKLWQDVPNNTGLALASEIRNCYGTNGTASVNTQGYSGWQTLSEGKTFNMTSVYGGAGRSDSRGSSADSRKACCFPCLGFEHAHITNWNQLYLSYFDSVANDETYDSDRTMFLKDDSNNYHVGIKNGLPLIKIPSNNCKITLDIDLRNITYNVNTGAETVSYPTNTCYLWVSDKPFTGWPNNSCSSETIEWKSPDNSCTTTTASDYSKAVVIPATNQGAGKIEITCYTKDKYLWLKWTTNGTYGGGAINIPATVICEEE